MCELKNENKGRFPATTFIKRFPRANCFMKALPLTREALRGPKFRRAARLPVSRQAAKLERENKCGPLRVRQSIIRRNSLTTQQVADRLGRCPPAPMRRLRRGKLRPDELRRLFERAGAIRTGHFELSSGRHSGVYIQCALVLQDPKAAEQLGRALAAEFHDLRVDCVASPALGGIILGHEVARAIGCRAIFVERDASGLMALRRGFEVQPHENALVVEDVWTTGGSTCETIRVVEQAGGRVVAAGALIDRSNGKLELPVRAEALIEMNVESYDAKLCPLCRAGDTPVRPGSRLDRIPA
jgi:orotate phosphoribosyltransferase